MTNKAYHCYIENGDIETQGIYFAVSRGKARRAAADDFGTDFIDPDLIVVRASPFDQFQSEQEIPDRFYYDRGWGLPCPRCTNIVFSHIVIDGDEPEPMWDGDRMVHCGKCIVQNGDGQKEDEED